ncbi:binding-protein-dependent transport system inner membrane protein [Brucella vulpis]|nr:binding-protein-dependent transport system inner membrane protein [Brucella vulpis]CUW50065.1 binding-protein-dependent transport system inner membrane protein [Brucella vulpis]
MFIGIVYSYLPFMVLPIYSSLEKMDYSLIEAAQDLGCTPFAAFWKITFPLSLAGVLAGCFLVFIPAVVLLVLLIVPIVIFQQVQARAQEKGK